MRRVGCPLRIERDVPRNGYALLIQIGDAGAVGLRVPACEDVGLTGVCRGQQGPRSVVAEDLRRHIALDAIGRARIEGHGQRNRASEIPHGAGGAAFQAVPCVFFAGAALQGGCALRETIVDCAGDSLSVSPWIRMSTTTMARLSVICASRTARAAGNADVAPTHRQIAVDSRAAVAAGIASLMALHAILSFASHATTEVDIAPQDDNRAPDCGKPIMTRYPLLAIRPLDDQRASSGNGKAAAILYVDGVVDCQRASLFDGPGNIALYRDRLVDGRAAVRDGHVLAPVCGNPVCLENSVVPDLE